ncbi:MAG: DNA-protecting protein DprA [Clostridia bacterium]|nr:DNA-protecting protein DprA [Clostridia bacterium]
MSLPDEAYWAAFNCSKIGYKNMLKIIDFFGGPKTAWEASKEEIAELISNSQTIEQFFNFKNNFNEQLYYEQVIKNNAEIISINDKCYPQNLKNIHGAPPVLYVKGNLPDPSLLHIAVVGTRRATIYGRQVARKISYDLATNGAVIVSGLARGIDSCAHSGALEAEGKTVAVLGCGIDVVYPRENRKLFDKISEEGAVITEFPLGTSPSKQNFPARNRIISGLSSGVLVVESPKRGGALITADLALEQGRDVFAVPGPIFSKTSEGCNALLKEGAKLVTRAEDILEEYQDFLDDSFVRNAEGTALNPSDLEGLSPEMKQIVELLSGGPVSIEELCQHTGNTAGQLNALITHLELEGLVARGEGKVYLVL